MKWCLHKGLAWCTAHGDYEVDIHIEVTTYSDLGRGTNVYICRACGGSKVEYIPPYKEPIPCDFGTTVPTGAAPDRPPTSGRSF